MLTVSFYYKGVVHHEFLPQGQTMNRFYYLAVFEGNVAPHNAATQSTLVIRDFYTKNHDRSSSTSVLAWFSPCRLVYSSGSSSPSKDENLTQLTQKSPEELKMISEVVFSMCFQQWKGRPLGKVCDKTVLDLFDQNSYITIIFNYTHTAKFII